MQKSSLILLTLGAVIGLSACITLTPFQSVRVVELMPVEGDRSYQIDQIDSSIV